MVSPFGFSLASFFHGAPLSLSHLAGSPFGLSLGAQLRHAGALEAAHHLVHLVGQVSIAACGVFSPVTATATFFHHSCASFG